MIQLLGSLGSGLHPRLVRFFIPDFNAFRVLLELAESHSCCLAIGDIEPVDDKVPVYWFEIQLLKNGVQEPSGLSA